MDFEAKQPWMDGVESGMRRKGEGYFCGIKGTQSTDDYSKTIRASETT
jgi:hypothetical protein